MSDDDNGTQRTHRFNIILEGNDAAKLLRAAHLRRIHPNKFLSQLVRVITGDNLIDAVLDDGGGTGKKPREARPRPSGYQPRPTDLT